MKDEQQLSHDILNMIERLRIMHDLARDKNFKDIAKEEILVDLEDTLKKLKQDIHSLLQ
jgi:hypothetical protein